MSRPPGRVPTRDSVSAGIGGLAPALAELRRSRALTGAEQALATGIVARLCAGVPGRAEPSLYVGLGGDVTALRLLAPGRSSTGRTSGGPSQPGCAPSTPVHRSDRTVRHGPDHGGVRPG